MMQIVEQTDEEKIAMYTKLKKAEIIKMLIQCNKVLNDVLKVDQIFVQHNKR